MAREPASLKDRIRRSGAMPLIAGSIAYLRAGGPFGGALRFNTPTSASSSRA